MPRKRKLSVASVEAALRANAGIQTAAASALGVHRNTVCRYVQRYHKLREALDEVRQENLDVVESKLMKAIAQDEPWAIKLYLMTQGKDRGYTYSSEITGAGRGPIEVIGEGGREKLARELDRIAPSNGAAGPPQTPQ